MTGQRTTVILLSLADVPLTVLSCAGDGTPAAIESTHHLIAGETAVIASRILAELKERLSEAYGERLHAVVLFGSEARGNAGPDSDIDIMAVLDELSGNYGDELERGLAAVYPVALRIGRRVSVKPLARDEYEQGDSPLLREVRRSGVAA